MYCLVLSVERETTSSQHATALYKNSHQAHLRLLELRRDFFTRAINKSFACKIRGDALGGRNDRF